MPPTVIVGGSEDVTCALGFQGATIIVDLTCDAYALEITADTETIDLATFCNPTASDLGRTTYSAVLSLLWSPAVYQKLLPHVGEVGGITFGAESAGGKITFQTKYAALPWGRFEVGQRVESELPLAVLSPPAYTVT